MKNWFLSLHGAIALSVMALLTFLGRLFLDWRYEASLLGPAGSFEEAVNVLLFLAFAGGWIWAMLAAIGGSHRGLIVSLILALLLDVAFAIMTYAVFCPPGCKGFPNLRPWSWAQLILGLLAGIVLVIQLRHEKRSS